MTTLNTISTYVSPEYDTVDGAIGDLHDFLEGVNVNVTILDMGVGTSLKDRERAVAWAMLNGINLPDTYHALTSENVTLTQINTLAVAAGSHVHSVGAVILTGEHSLAVAAGSHVHEAENLSLTQYHSLVVSDAGHTLESESIVLTQGHVLSVNYGIHGLESENLVLS